MKTKLPVSKNDNISLEISALGSEGQGIGRKDGFAVFVPHALPGENVSAHVIKVTSGYAVAKLTEILQESPDRVPPECGAFLRCGGCALQHMSYDAQCKAKQKQVQDALERVGGFHGVQVQPIIGMQNPWRYRNKGSFPLGLEGEGVSFGFFAPRSHRLIPLNDCPIQNPVVISVAQAVKRWAEACGIEPYNEEKDTGILRHAMARVAKDGKVMAVVVTTGPLPNKERLIAELAGQVKNLCSIVHNTNGRQSNVILGEEYHVIWGQDRLDCELCGLHFMVSAASFLQVNNEQTEKLYKTALDFLDLQGGETVVDAYCGIGTISLLLAQSAGRVIGIENVPQAVNDARHNADMNGIVDAEFLCEDAERALPRLVQAGLRPDVVVLDPPRKGCEEPALQAIANCGASKILYISCNPATLARDAKYLADAGFEIKKVQPIDMFPQTMHVETVVLMSRVKNSRTLLRNNKPENET